MAASDIGKAQANPCLRHVLAIDGVAPTPGGVVSFDADGDGTVLTQASLVPGLSGSATEDIGSIGAGLILEATVTVTGAAAGGHVILGLPSAFPAGLTATGYVSGADTVKIRLHNTTAAPIDPTGLLYKVRVIP